MVRQRLANIVNDGLNMSVIGEAVSPWHAISGIMDSKPDVVVLDIGLVGGSGMHVLRKLHALSPHLPVIVLTNYFSPEFKQACLSEGAQYFFDKTNEFDQVKQALEQIASSNAMH